MLTCTPKDRTYRFEPRGASGGSWAAPQEVEDQHDDADYEQNVDESRAYVERQKTEQPENN